ncbi:MAG: hypothetical protein AUK47_14935 [Deltaproteobacteria bacterium CG2_30_63_29]|nr:MAG: hypothetical protein AUK47_14935 [Deltaproteobacteria bacterium CG2_30_63_29]PJB43056.1 MAG: hypothetical protein CO108_10610 [Deltaproteobacteria bacterium CG_4_9_14_3_um_filter_63_12]
MTKKLIIVLLLVLLVLSLLPLACSSNEEAAPEPSWEADTKGEPLVKTTTVGPVTVTVTALPAAPKLGDPVLLTLEAKAEPGVELHMPAFGEQLGRFNIVDYKPDSGTNADDSSYASQTYTLDLPMSGKQRIPQLLVEFVDNRKDSPTPGELMEVLTDELTLEVESVLPESGVTVQLRPLRGPLDELEALPGEEPVRWPYYAVGALLLVLLAGFLFVLIQRRALERAKESAFDVALKKLLALQAQGLPEPDEVDDWYVALSDIVRRYLEARYGLRAPELTTQEFLLLAYDIEGLEAKHRALLSSLLERADRVKFARYLPQSDESREAIETARRFIEESNATLSQGGAA